CLQFLGCCVAMCIAWIAEERSDEGPAVMRRGARSARSARATPNKRSAASASEQQILRFAQDDKRSIHAQIGADDRVAMETGSHLRQDLLSVLTKEENVREHKQLGLRPCGEIAELDRRRVKGGVIASARAVEAIEALLRVDLVHEYVASVAGLDNGFTGARVA